MARQTRAFRQRRKLPGALRLAVEAAAESGMETDGNPTTPQYVGAQVAEHVGHALTPAGFGDILAGAKKAAFARRFATVFRKAFVKQGRSSYLFTALEPSDVIDVFSKWAKIEWAGVEAERDRQRAAEIAMQRTARKHYEREQAALATMSFGQRLAAGAWQNWLSDPALREQLLSPPARAEHAAQVARGLGPAPRAPSGLALLALLGDAGASEELASQLGDPKLTDAARRTLEACAKARLPTPVASARAAREVAKLAPGSIDAWLLAALCARRLPHGELEHALPEASALIAAANEAIDRVRRAKQEVLEHRFVYDAVLAWLTAAVAHDHASITEAAHLCACSVIDQFLSAGDRRWPDEAHVA